MPSLGRKTPCATCPWRRTSRRGYLGDDDPIHFYRQAVTNEGMMPCHEQIDYSDPDWVETQLPVVDLCAGNLIFFRNFLKMPRRRELYLAVMEVKARIDVFESPIGFLRHHLPDAAREEIRAAVESASHPFGSE
jgi:hypothetical protein